MYGIVAVVTGPELTTHSPPYTKTESTIFTNTLTDRTRTTAQVVERSVTVNNDSPIQDYVHPDDQTQPFKSVNCLTCSFGFIIRMIDSSPQTSINVSSDTGWAASRFLSLQYISITR